MKLPALKDIAAHAAGRPRDPRRGHRAHGAGAALRRARHAARADAAPASRSRRSRRYAEKLWDYWERNLDPDLFKDRSFAGAVNGKTVVITGASSGIGRAAALKIAAAGGIPLLVARTAGEARGGQGRDRGAPAAPPTSTRPTCPTTTRSTRWSERILADHAVGRRARQQRGPLDPALGRALLRPLPRLRAHDPAQLPRHDQADPRPAAAHAREAARATSSTSARSACRPTRRASRPTSRRRRRSTRSRAS